MYIYEEENIMFSIICVIVLIYLIRRYLIKLDISYGYVEVDTYNILYGMVLASLLGLFFGYIFWG